MSSTAGTGVETLQMIMKTQPLSNREVPMVIGDSKTPAETTQEDIKRREDAPEIHVPADAPADFDINQLLVQSHGEDEDYIELEAEDLYEDMEAGSRGRLSLASAFVSSKDPATLTLAPQSRLEAAPGALVYIK